LSFSEFGIIVEANVPIVAERRMTWDRPSQYGSHEGMPSPSASSRAIISVVIVLATGPRAWEKVTTVPSALSLGKVVSAEMVSASASTTVVTTPVCRSRTYSPSNGAGEPTPIAADDGRWVAIPFRE
jgi:hypothetical protein